ncbi:hypothetical protein SAMN05421863_1005111 [Nitrosomonas communis]|uniref:Uncharacterized protein n=1 Tax=Nitrosomonas communis TaxID=44574 RepID=A0A1I4L1M5_9PROT|nr:hypothetical protein SAMN05421863_1005111 [Nitrosomonas communis]
MKVNDYIITSGGPWKVIVTLVRLESIRLDGINF